MCLVVGGDLLSNLVEISSCLVKLVNVKLLSGWNAFGAIHGWYGTQPFFMHFVNHVNKTCPRGKELEALSRAQVK